LIKHSTEHSQLVNHLETREELHLLTSLRRVFIQVTWSHVMVTYLITYVKVICGV